MSSVCVTPVLGLIEAHYHKDEEGFERWCDKVIEELQLARRDQLVDYILSVQGKISSFVPMEGDK